MLLLNISDCSHDEKNPHPVNLHCESLIFHTNTQWKRNHTAWNSSLPKIMAMFSKPTSRSYATSAALRKFTEESSSRFVRKCQKSLYSSSQPSLYWHQMGTAPSSEQHHARIKQGRHLHTFHEHLSNEYFIDVQWLNALSPFPATACQ